MALPNKVLLTPASVLLIQKGSSKALLSQSQFWHKFIIIDGASLDTQSVLRTVVNDVKDLFPIQYTTEGRNTSFIAHNCGPAIEYLCQKNLIVDCCDGKQITFNIILNGGVPNATTLKIQDWLFEILQGRYDRGTKCLNLQNLENDPKLINQLYCSLDNSKIFTFVLSLVRNFEIKTLILSNNCIRSIDALELFWSARKLTSIDLRDNRIEYISDIIALKNIPITTLWLEGNPICQYYDEASYLSNIKGICPKIENLDGIAIVSAGLISSKKNFFIDKNGKQFVDQFLEHYFTLYDSPFRSNLKLIYHNNAIFSTTFSFLPGQSTSKDSQFGIYQYRCRNLLTLCDISKFAENLFVGPQQILAFFALLPKTEHDKLSFTVDLLAYSENIVVILVTGVVREFNQNRFRVQYLHFTRTFVLISVGNGEYQIINEQLHVSNATTEQTHKLQNFIKPITPSYNSEEESQIIENFARITTTNLTTAQKFVMENDWDLRVALACFIEKYKSNQISPESFSV